MMYSLRISLLLLFVWFAPPLAAQHIPSNLPGIRADISGNWFDPAQAGHGIQIEVLDHGRATIAWYTFDADGNPLWLFGLGRFDFDTITVELGRLEGGRPPGLWDEADVVSEIWGTVEVQFSGCDTAQLRWNSPDPDFGTGELDLIRLTGLQGLRCNAEELFSLQLAWSFERRMQGFEAVFADLPEHWDQPTYQIDYRREDVPPPLNGYRGLRLTSHNSSDDLAMLVKTPVEGLLPETIYRVELDVEIATNVPFGCSGVGGSPGESVYVKLGASAEEPVAEVDPADGWLRLNIDFGNQSQEGMNARVVGDLSNSASCDDGLEADWELKALTTRGQPMLISTDADGTLWVFAGTDSAFEGLTQYYITALRARLEPYEPETAR